MSYTYHLEYLGNATVDKRLSNPMVPWIVAQIRRGDSQKKVSVRVDRGTIEVRKEDTNALICSHSLQLVSRLTVQPMFIFYAVRDKEQPLLYCHLFQSSDQHTILDMMATMKEQSNKLQSRTTTALCPDISPSSSHFFEVLYVGRIKVSHKRIPDTFIDDALEKFRNLEKIKKGREQSEAEENKLLNGSRQAYGSTEVLQSETETDCDNPPVEKTRRRSGSLGSLLMKKDTLCKDNCNGLQPELNRTMVFHVGRTDLRLISPDRKQVLLHKYLKDITYSQQGIKNPSHFGFICKENVTEPPSYIAYVFNCQCSSVADDLVAAISQASLTDKKTTVVSCERCPMVWYHKLCSELEGLSDKGMEEAVTRRLETLPVDEQAIVHTKLQGAELPQGNTKEYIQLVMMLLRAHCESKQARHVHDTPENRHEFLSHYLGGGTIFMKAKRSLTSSFDQLLKRKSSSNDFNQSMSLPPNTTLKDMVQEVNRNHSPSSETIDGSTTEEASTTGSMMTIFMKLGNSPRTPSVDSRLDEGGDVHEQPRSWRQAIFQNVVTPSKALQENAKQEERKKDKQFYRDLWKKAINQQVLLIRMEKENVRLTERQEEANVKRIKLEYAEIGTVEPSDVWDIIIKDDKKLESTMIMNAVKTGIPKAKRGEVWLHLTKQRTDKIAPFNSSNFPNYNVSYEQLLKQLTSHQHSILIDLGRTFPSHTYFSSPLGPGQLALFNLLKAYSLLDPEVGYCQGLSFIAAALLLHMSESDAFFVLKQLMFRQGIRSRYLPDMTALQVSLYQLSRLLHDRHPDLYAHFDALDVAPTLYAAPWLLTLFASQFPLGFVARVFDLMFADSPIVLFKIALALLDIHKADLLECDSFESIMEYLKVKLPQIDTPTMDKLVKEVMVTEITKEMNEYGVEYHVLQEEMTAPRPELKRLRDLETANVNLTQQVTGLNQQLQIATSNINRLEASRSFHMSQLNKLESQVKCLEVTVVTLGQFISDLGYSKQDIQIPNEILRILTQINISQKKKIMRPQMSSPEFSAADLKRVKEELEAKQITPVASLGRTLTDEDKAALAARQESRSDATMTSTNNNVSTNKPSAPLPQVTKLLKSTQSSFELGSTHFHPLDTNGVHTSFGGTTHLKKIQLQKNNRSKSSKNIELKIIEAPSGDQDHSHEAQLLIKSQAMKTKTNGVS